MSTISTFHDKYSQLRRDFEQAVQEEAAKITLTDLLREIDSNNFRNPIRPRFDVSSELMAFNEGDMIQFGVLYQSGHGYSNTFRLDVTPNKAELYHSDSETKVLRTFSGSKVTSLYNDWLRKLEEAKGQLQEQDLPF